MPSKSRILLFFEGSTEELYFSDFLENHGTFNATLEDGEIDTQIIHMNRFSDEYEDYQDQYDEVFAILDNDDPAANKQVNYAMTMAKRTGTKLIVLKQRPLMETFIAAHFPDFIIDKNWTEHELKKESQDFVCQKYGVSNIKSIKKKMTLTKIINKGGHYKHTLRYEKRFDIIKILVFV